MIVRLLRWLLGAVFIAAGCSKLADPAAFAVDIDHYRLLPHPVALALAVYLPWLEILAGVAVLAGRWLAGAYLLQGGLCVLFCIAIGSAWYRGLDIECGCFGQSPSAIPLYTSLARAAALGIIAFILYRRDVRRPVSTKSEGC